MTVSEGNQQFKLFIVEFLETFTVSTNPKQTSLWLKAYELLGVRQTKGGYSSEDFQRISKQLKEGK